jgi:GT2 family glycosyltransferase
MPAPEATVIIVTRDRRADALRAVASAVAQKPAPEVLIIDDGSTDGRPRAYGRPSRRESRAIRGIRGLHRAAQSGGAELASGRILVSIDDDAEIPSNDVVAVTVGEFDGPQVGAVAIPYVDLPDEEVHQRATGAEVAYLIHRFRGTAYAVRRDVFLRIGSFRTVLFHQAEEADFCLRLLNAGYVVRLGSAAPIRHHASPTRMPERAWFYECRNGVLFAWNNVPMPDLLAQLAKRTVHMLWLGSRVRRTCLFARGLLAGYAAALRHRSSRRPVRRSAWRLYKR